MGGGWQIIYPLAQHDIQSSCQKLLTTRGTNHTPLENQKGISPPQFRGRDVLWFIRTEGRKNERNTTHAVASDLFDQLRARIIICGECISY